MNLVEEFFKGVLRIETPTEVQETRRTETFEEDRKVRIARYEAEMDSLLDPMNAPWPSDGFPNMGDRVRAVAQMTVEQRVECMFKARDTLPDYLTNLERRQWAEGMGQIGG